MGLEPGNRAGECRLRTMEIERRIPPLDAVLCALLRPGGSLGIDTVPMLKIIRQYPNVIVQHFHKAAMNGIELRRLLFRTPRNDNALAETG